MPSPWARTRTTLVWGGDDNDVVRKKKLSELDEQIAEAKPTEPVIFFSISK